MLIDCFTFFNELDLLEIRLKTLEPYVDQFVIAEGDMTFQGQPKTLHILNNLHKFNVLESKIQYVPVQFQGRTHGWTAWQREAGQRRALGNWLFLHPPKDDDIVMLSDVDEIPDLNGPVMHKPGADWKELIRDGNPAVWIQDMTYYWVDWWAAKWRGTIAWQWKDIVSRAGGDFQRFRDCRGARAYLVNPGGWHLAYLGGIRAIRDKIRAFSHTELAEYNTEENIIKQLRQGADLFHRNLYQFREITEEERLRLPPYLLENENRFGYMWRPK